MHDKPADGVKTTCPYCGVGCGVIATVAPDGAVGIQGDPNHPANFGKLCSKGAALGETTALDDRLLVPQIGTRSASWDDALDLVADTFAKTIAAHGPDSVAFYVSGQMLTEDYYVANKLMKGFIGSANIDTNSRLCMASSVSGHKRAFGEDIVPGLYEDIEQADLVVLTGSNTAWCHPVLYQRLLAARAARGTRIVVIDPRRTATADDCDLHLAIAPGADVLLFNGLLAHLVQTGSLADGYIAAHTAGFGDATRAAMEDATATADIARLCGLDESYVIAFYDMFAATERTVTVYSQGINQSAQGTDKVNAIFNCHLATGRIGRPGMGPFSVTGQPNAMGGREVGGLANQLAAHMGFDAPADIARVARFWDAPRIARQAGLKAVDMFRAVEAGTVKAIWIMGTNPAVSMPDAGRVREALKACNFVVVSDITQTDTTGFADILLPAAGWGEKSGTVTNSERRLSRQRPFLPAPGLARPDWAIICDVARRMGFGNAFAYSGPADIFREHAALSAFENDGARLFDIGSLAGLSDVDYESFTPRLWPAPAAAQSQSSTGRLLDTGRFPTPDGRARFIAVRQTGVAVPVDPDWPLALNTGRLRDQWHTMTRTGRVPRLAANVPEPAVEIHPTDASANGLTDGDIARVSSRYGWARARIRVTPAQRPGDVFLPMHWSGQYAGCAGTGPLATPDNDPVSGQPELKHVAVRLSRESIAWAGVFISRRSLRPTGFVHWSRHAIAGGWAYDLCGTETPDQGVLLSRTLLECPDRERLIEYTDRYGMSYRAVAVDEAGALTEALLVAPPSQLPPRDWLMSLLGARTPLTASERMAVLSGRSPVSRPSPGRIVCACFNVGANQIAAAAAAGCSTVAAIGQTLQAGTNCGSCRSEIRTLIDENRLQAAE